MDRVPRTEYPRPQFRREESTCINLNGEWEYEFDFGVSGGSRGMLDAPYSGKILVPFAPESVLSGVEYVDFIPSMWYRRRFNVPQDAVTGKRRLILHFGAVNYHADVWMNGQHLGAHSGGYTPFSFDITETVKNGENALVLWVKNDVRNPLQPSGKQSPDYRNSGCMYTRSTGIWQTVWLEIVPLSYIRNVKMTPDVDNEKLDITAYFSASAENAVCDVVTAKAFYKGEPVSEITARVCGTYCTFSLPVKNPKLWEPGNPELYDLIFTYGEDTVVSYFGMRKVAIRGYAIEINDKPVFQRLVLDQGYYPDGIYTAPNDEALKKDIELSMRAGFNGARLHMKVFEPRFLYHADHMGYLVWGEYPNWGLDDSNPAAVSAMLPEWMEAVARDYNSPAIIGWCPLNETSAGRNALTHTIPYEVTKAIDPMRPVIDTSGYVHTEKHDIFDVHDYTQEPEEFAKHYAPLKTGEGEPFINGGQTIKYNGEKPFFVSEYGGTRWVTVENKENWGYGQAPEDIEAFYRRIEGLTDVLLTNPKICAFCYTQLTDVFQETNGIYCFDRSEKFDMERIRGIFGKERIL